MDKEQLSKPAEPWEFRSKPAWQRLIIMVGGVTVNLLLGMAIYIGILWAWGRDYLPKENAQFGIHVSPTAEANGFKEGDMIMSVNGVNPRSIEEAQSSILIDNARDLVVRRGGEDIALTLPEGFGNMAVDAGEKALFQVRIPFYIDSILPKQNAARSTLLKGDRIVAIDGQPTPYFEDFRRKLRTLADSYAAIVVERNGQITTSIVRVDGNGTIGVMPMGYKGLVEKGFGFATVHESFSFANSIPEGIKSGVEILGKYVSSLKFLFSKSGASQIGGFGSIGGLFSPTWDWQVFWNMTAFLSIILAFMNILPIPALDGGHVVFLLYEMVTRRPPNQRVLEVAQMIGMVLLLGLLLYANGNDLFKALMN